MISLGFFLEDGGISPSEKSITIYLRLYLESRGVSPTETSGTIYLVFCLEHGGGTCLRNDANDQLSVLPCVFEWKGISRFAVPGTGCTWGGGGGVVGRVCETGRTINYYNFSSYCARSPIEVRTEGPIAAICCRSANWHACSTRQ